MRLFKVHVISFFRILSLVPFVIPSTRDCGLCVLDFLLNTKGTKVLRKVSKDIIKNKE
jgi:hypothetical protein